MIGCMFKYLLIQNMSVGLRLLGNLYIDFRELYTNYQALHIILTKNTIFHYNHLPLHIHEEMQTQIYSNFTQYIIFNQNTKNILTKTQ